MSSSSVIHWCRPHHNADITTQYDIEFKLEQSVSPRDSWTDGVQRSMLPGSYYGHMTSNIHSLQYAD